MIKKQNKCYKKISKSPNGEHHSGLVETVEKNEKKKLGEERALVGNNFYFGAGAASIARTTSDSP